MQDRSQMSGQSGHIPGPSQRLKRASVWLPRSGLSFRPLICRVLVSKGNHFVDGALCFYLFPPTAGAVNVSRRHSLDCLSAAVTRDFWKSIRKRKSSKSEANCA